MARTENGPTRVLIVTTSAGSYEKAGYRTGLWLGELTHFWDVLARDGHDLTIASIAGGRVPIDPESLTAPMLMIGGTKKRYQDPAFMDRLDDTVSVADVADEEWDAVYLTGGHGTMFDFPYDPALGDVLATTLEAGRVVSAVCHGPSGFIGARLSDGTPLLQGRRVTGYSWPEEKLAHREKVVPFRLDEALKAEGAKYSKAWRPMASSTVTDRNLVTGQNPFSATAVAKVVAKMLKRRR